MKKTMFFVAALLVVWACGSSGAQGSASAGDTPQTDVSEAGNAADSLVSEDMDDQQIVCAPEEDWTEEAVAKQVREYFDAVNKTFAQDLSRLDLDKQFYTSYWNEVYDKVNQKDGSQGATEECFFVEDFHWTGGLQAPVTVKDIKVELLTGDSAEAMFTLVENESGFESPQVLILDYERGKWRIGNWLDESKDSANSLLVGMEKYVNIQ